VVVYESAASRQGFAVDSRQLYSLHPGLKGSVDGWPRPFSSYSANVNYRQVSRGLDMGHPSAHNLGHELWGQVSAPVSF